MAQGDVLFNVEVQNIGEVGQLNGAIVKLSDRRTRLRRILKEEIRLNGQNTRRYQQLSRALGKTQIELDQTRTKFNQIKREVRDSSKGIKKLRPIGVQTARGLKNAFKSAGAAFVAAFGVQQIGSIINEMIKLEQKVHILFDGTESELDAITQRVNELSTTSGKDFNEVISATNSLSKQMGITAQEALDLIEEGFTKGADVNNEFLSILKEYPTHLKSVGLEADEAIAILTQTQTEGVFSDKGIDAIKEASINLKKFTPAAQEALDALDLSVTDIEQELREGSASIFDIIQRVSRRMSELPPQSKKVAKAFADIFGGPGEDAGEFILTLGDINTELKNIEDQTTAATEAQAKLSRAWAKFKGIVAKATVAVIEFANSMDFTTGVRINEELSKAQELFGESTETLMLPLVGLTDAGNELLKNYRELLKANPKLIRQVGYLAESTGRARNEFFLFDGETARLTVEAQTLIKESRNLAFAFFDISKKTEGTEEKIKTLGEKTNTLIGRIQRINPLASDLASVFEDVAEALASIDESITPDKLTVEELFPGAAPTDVSQTLFGFLFGLTGEQEQEAVKLAKDGAFNIAQTVADTSFQLQQQRLQREQQAEIDSLEARRQAALQNESLTEAGRLRITKQFDQERRALEFQAFERQKRIETQQAIINGALAITQSLANTTLPFPASLIAPTTIAAQTAAQIAVIQAAKFAKGGIMDISQGKLIRGASHKQGGVMVEGEGGEAVINKKSTQMFRPLLSEMNQIGGGKKFATGGVLAAPQISSQHNLQGLSQQIGQEIARQISSIPVKNVAVETTDTSRSVLNIRAKARF